jgi:pilus assembly protein CpaB
MGRRLVAIFAAALVALVGVTAVLLYARGADARAVAAQQPTSVYVVKSIVPSGTTLKDAVQNGLIIKTSVAAAGVPAGALTGVDGSNGGLYATTDIQPGEYVLGDRFGVKPVGEKAITVPAGMVAVSVQLADPARVGTFLTPGSKVVLYDTYAPAAAASSKAGTTEATAAGQTTRVLLDDVLIIAMGQASLTPAAAPVVGEEAAPAPVLGALMTVAVTPADATRLVHGIQTGALYAALRGTDAKIDLGKVVSEASLFSK